LWLIADYYPGISSEFMTKFMETSPDFTALVQLRKHNVEKCDWQIPTNNYPNSHFKQVSIT